MTLLKHSSLTVKSKCVTSHVGLSHRQTLERKCSHPPCDVELYMTCYPSRVHFTALLLSCLLTLVFPSSLRSHGSEEQCCLCSFEGGSPATMTGCRYNGWSLFSQVFFVSYFLLRHCGALLLCFSTSRFLLPQSQPLGAICRQLLNH